MDLLAVAVIINNYLHELATGLLLAAAVILWTLMKQASKENPADVASMGRALPTLTRFARWALVWVVVGGVPRVIFFNDYEWDPAVVDGIVPALIVKHVLMVAAIGAGALMWRKARRLLAYAGKAHDLSALHDDDGW